MGQTVTLKLEKNGETQEITMKTSSMMDMAKKAARLGKLNKDGWAVVDVYGSDPEKVAFMKRIAGGYVPGAGEMLKAAGLSAMPKPLKKLFKKEDAKT